MINYRFSTNISMIQFFYFVCILVRKHVKASEISIENRWYWRYHRYRHLSNIGQILVFKTYLCSSNRYKNLIKIKINISLLYACILVQCIEETGGRTERHRIQEPGRHRHNSSIPYVNGGTLIFFQLPPIKQNCWLSSVSGTVQTQVTLHRQNVF